MPVEKYTLTLNSKNDKARAIAMTDDDTKTFIDMEKVKNKDDIKREVETELDILPIFHRPEDQNIRIYVAGQSGCGKTYFTAEILKVYHKIYSKQKIYLFTSLDYDKHYDGDKTLKKHIIRYQLTDENAELLTALNIDDGDLKDSICVFDDFLLTEPILRKIVDTIKNVLLKRGRHYNTDVLIINDKILGGHKTITEMNQSNYICVFPYCTNFYEIESALTKYIGLSKSDIEKVREIEDETRWMCFYKIYPKYCVHQRGALLFTKR